MQGVAQASFEPISPQATIVLHMPDGWFNGTSSVNGFFDGWRHTAFLTATPDGDSRDVDTPIALVDKDGLGEAIGQNADLLDSLRQGVAVVGIARHAAHANDEPFLVCGRHRDFDAKFIRLARLALGDALRSGSEKSGIRISDISASMGDGSRRPTGAESNEKTSP